MIFIFPPFDIFSYTRPIFVFIMYFLTLCRYAIVSLLNKEKKRKEKILLDSLCVRN